MGYRFAAVVVIAVAFATPAAAQDGGRLYEEACAADDLRACDVLGLMLLAGRGVFQDLDRAAALFRRACDGGQATGCAHLGLMYHTGAGVGVDVAAAAALYRRACELGEPSACANLETMGLGSPADTVALDGFARSGRVVDAGTRLPLEGAIVHLPDLGIRVTTGQSGRVALGRLPAGRHRITAERVGYDLLDAELRVPWEAGFVLLLNRATVDDPRAPGRVVGRVIDDGEGRGLEDVAVTVSGPTRAGTLSDRQGRFELRELEPGATELNFTRLGYAPRSTTLVVHPGRTVEIEASMSTELIELDPIEVSVRSSYLERNGFYRRIEGAGGHQFTRDDLDRLDPMHLSDLLWRVPGVSLSHDRYGVHAVSRRGGTFQRGPCRLRVFLDGVATSGWDLDQVPPEWLEGVEVYRGVGTPLRYAFGQNPCGAILLWTRRGR